MLGFPRSEALMRLFCLNAPSSVPVGPHPRFLMGWSKGPCSSLPDSEGLRISLLIKIPREKDPLVSPPVTYIWVFSMNLGAKLSSLTVDRPEFFFFSLGHNNPQQDLKESSVLGVICPNEGKLRPRACSQGCGKSTLREDSDFLILHTHSVTHAQFHTFTLVHSHLHIGTGTHTNTFTLIRVYLHILTLTCTHICAYMDTRRHLKTFSHTHTEMHTYVLRGTHIHSLTQLHNQRFSYFHIPIGTHTCTQLHTQAYWSAQTLIFAYVHMSTHTYTQSHLYTACICSYTRTHKYTFSYTHTHIHSRWQNYPRTDPRVGSERVRNTAPSWVILPDCGEWEIVP